MSEPFFHPLGDEITISDKDELVKIILEIDFEIGASKTSNFRERFTLGQYLLTLASLSQLECPFSIEKHETPDLEFLTKLFEVVPTDEYTSDVEQGLMDLGPPLPADS